MSSTIFAIISLAISGLALWRTYHPNLENMHQHMHGKIQEILKNKPEIVLDAITALSQKQVTKHEKDQKKTIAKNKKALFQNQKDPVDGNPTGTLDVIEFFDYRCGHCRHVFGGIHEAVKKDGAVRFVYKEFPIFPGDPLMSKAALAAHRQGKYQDLHKAFMASSGELGEDEILTIAEKVGLNVDQLKKDMHDPEIEKQIAANKALGRKLNIEGTPAFIIGETVVPGALETEEFINAFQKERQA